MESYEGPKTADTQDPRITPPSWDPEDMMYLWYGGVLLVEGV